MQVILKGSPDFNLADGAEHGLNKRVGPGDDMRVGAKVNLQVDEILRATAVKIRNRGNLSGRVSFSVQMECNSIEAATFQAFAFPFNVPRAGDIWFVEGTRTIKLIGGGIEDISTVQIGKTIIITYTIVYGAVEFVG